MELFTKDGRERGFGVVIRDHHSIFVGGCGASCSAGSTPSMVEALALLQGVRFVRRIAGSRVEVESDANLVIDELNGGHNSITTFGQIYELFS